jgi:probable rRNA maturation factor
MFSPRPPRSIAIRNAHPRLRVPRAAVRKVVQLLDAQAGKFLGGCPPGELSLVFLTDPALAKIHGEFMDDPTPTDVITFEGDRSGTGDRGLATDPGSAGEICVSADTAARFVGLAPASTQHAPVLREKFAEELTLYLVHGWLHLSGYDDRKPAVKRRMRAAEKRAMDLLRKAMAIPAFRLA